MMRRWLLLLVLHALLFSSALHASEPATALVTLPIVDVRKEPSFPKVTASDPNEETQILFGETVHVLDTNGIWSRVEVPDQPEFTHHQKWEGYPGWVTSYALKTGLSPATLNAVVRQKWLTVLDKPKGVELMHLPLGARVGVIRRQNGWAEINLLDGRTGWVLPEGLKSLARARSEHQVRTAILQTAQLLTGDLYAWGGRSPADPAARASLSGVDCSGLVHLSYGVNGIVIPRDSHEQYMQAKALKRRELKAADLIFSASTKDPQKVVHVMLYAGENWVIEAPQTGLPVRKIHFEEKVGRPLKTVESGETVGDRVIYFGRLLSQ